MPFVVGDVQFRITADDRKLLADLAEAERAARRSAQNIRQSLGGIDLGGAARFGLQVAGLGVGFSAAQAAAEGLHRALDATIGTGIRLNASLETATLQFQTLMGSADAAASHVRDLFQFAAETPFAAEETIAASRNLRTLGGAALDTAPNLKLVGDAAAATSSGIQEVAFWTARAYSQIQAGRPFGEAAQRLQELGILSGTTRNQLEALQKAGAGSDQIWSTFAAGLARFEGAMQRQAQTFDGLTSTLSDNLGQLSAIATRPIFDALKTEIRSLNETLSSKETQQSASDFAATLERIGIAVGNSAENFRLADEALNRYLQDLTNHQGLLGIALNVAGQQIAGPQAGTLQGPVQSPEPDLFAAFDRFIGRGVDTVGPEARRAQSIANAQALKAQADAANQLADAEQHAAAMQSFAAAAQKHDIELAAEEDRQRTSLADALHREEQARAAARVEQEKQNEAFRVGLIAGQFDPAKSKIGQLATADDKAAQERQQNQEQAIQQREQQQREAQQKEEQRQQQARDQLARESEARLRAQEDDHIAAVREAGRESVAAAQAGQDAETERHHGVMDGLRDEAEARQEIARERQGQLQIDQAEIAAARSVADARQRVADAESAAARAQSGLGRPGDFRRTQGAQAEAIRNARNAVRDAQAAAQTAALGQGVTALEAAGLGTAGILTPAEQAAQVARLREQLAARARAGLLSADEQRQAQAVLDLASRPRGSLTDAQRAAVDKALAASLRQGDEAAQRAERQQQREEDRLNRENTERLQKVVAQRQVAADLDIKAAEKQLNAARAQRDSAAAWARINGVELPPPTSDAFGQPAPATPAAGSNLAPPPPAAGAGGASAAGALPPQPPLAGAGGVSVQVIYQAPVTIGGGMDVAAFTAAQVTAIQEGVRRVGG